MPVKVTIHGAISIVNAIATGKGATLGISNKVEVTASITSGKGIRLESVNKNLSSRLAFYSLYYHLLKRPAHKNMSP